MSEQLYNELYGNKTNTEQHRWLSNYSSMILSLSALALAAAGDTFLNAAVCLLTIVAAWLITAEHEIW